MGLVRALAGAFTDFWRAGCTSLAAALAFFALLSFFPLVFLLLYVIGFFVSHDRIGHEFLLSFLEGFLPIMGAELGEEVKRVASEQVVQWIVLLTFAWFGLLVFYELDYAMNVVFGTQHQRHPLISAAVSAAVLGLVAFLMILSYVVTEALDFIVRTVPSNVGLDAPAIAAHQFLLSYVAPFTLLVIATTCLYRFVPRIAPCWRDAFVGGVVQAVLWELSKHFFSTYVQHLAIYGRMYGSLLVVVLFLIWVYYSAALLLFGAAVVRRLQASR